MTKRLFNNTQRGKNKKKYNIFMNVVILNLLAINSISGNDYISEIRLVIKGTEYQNIISNDYGGTLPYEVIVNGYKRTDCEKICYLDKEINNVTLKFDTSITDCTFMFNHVYNIIEVDLSNFDSSNVNTMLCMFQACISLEKVNFGNIDLSSLKSLFGLFAYCTNLKIVNLSNIDISQVESLAGMFDNCRNLIYLDLSNFNTQNVKEMHKMFNNCSSLIYLNLNTDKFKLKDESVNTDDIFYSTSSNTKFCINDPRLREKLSLYGKISNCSDICFKENIKIDITNKICVESCQNKKYEENNICFNECRIGYYPIFCESNDCDENPINCYDKAPEKYYFDSNNKSYKKCYETCKSCFGEGNKTDNNCIECDNDYLFLNDSLHEKNCYIKCEYYYYFDESNEYKCTEQEICPNNYKLIESKKKCINKCENDNYYKYEYNLNCYIKCPEGTINEENSYICYIKEITTNIIYTTDISEKKLISSYIDLSTYNNIIIKEITHKNNDIASQTNIVIENKEQTTNEITNGNKDIVSHTNLEIESEDETNKFEKIRKKLIKGDYTTEINNGKDSIYIDGNYIYTVTSTKNQDNNKDYNTTAIYLGLCENELKEEYNISKNDSLYILKVDILIDDLIIPKVEYEIFYPFNPINMTQLNLSICKDIKIYIRVPLTISKDDIDKHNSSSNLYNDICYILKNEKGLDKPIKARRDDFIKYKYSGCEEGCEFSEYDIINKIALCSCFTKINLPILSEIKIDKKKLYSNFKNIKNIGNFKLLSCMHLLFDNLNIFKNSSNYMNISLLLINTISIFVVVFYNQINIKNFINKSIKANDNKNEAKKLQKKKKKITLINNVRNINWITIANIYKHRPKNHNYTNNPINNHKKNNNKNKAIFERISSKNLILKTQKKNEFKKHNDNNKFQNKARQRTNSHLKTKNTSIIDNLNRKQINNNYNDNEMNNLKFEEAIRIDHRTYCLYYFSLIKCKHILISTFCYFNDYNAQIIKIYMFFFTFVSNFVFSEMFYSETTMNKIYIEDGAFDLTYQLPKMFYSLIISNLLKILLNYLGLYENSLIAIKRNIKYKIQYKEILLHLKIKLTLFFIINYIIIFGFWIYLGCFCAVYSNTQVHLVKEVASSFSISFIIPFFINIFPGIFRIHALNKKAKNKCLYNFSKILQ